MGVMDQEGEEGHVFTSKCCDAIHAKDVSVDEGYSFSQGTSTLVIRIARQGEVRLSRTAAGKLAGDLMAMSHLLDAADSGSGARS